MFFLLDVATYFVNFLKFLLSKCPQMCEMRNLSELYDDKQQIIYNLLLIFEAFVHAL